VASSADLALVLGGDEIRRYQGGNNNARCRDNDISWYHWDRSDNGAFPGPSLGRGTPKRVIRRRR
jgi:pullulanase/glycogen debranching enzyme